MSSGWQTVPAGQSWFPRQGTQVLLLSHLSGEGQSDDLRHCTQLKELHVPKLKTEDEKTGAEAQQPASTSMGTTGRGPAS
jgi:hypothetical protein